MTDFDIKTTTAYKDALAVEAKKAKKSVDKLGPRAKLRAEAAAWKVLESVGEAASAVNATLTAVNEEEVDDSVLDLITHGLIHPRRKVKVKKAALSKGPSKKALAIESFIENEGARRKDAIAALMTDADLTEKGAATYYQNIKSGKKGWEITAVPTLEG